MANTVNSFTCPFCNHHSILGDPNTHIEWLPLKFKKELTAIEKKVGLNVAAIVCPNIECKQISLSVTLGEEFIYNGISYFNSKIQLWRLLPESSAKPQPSYIPRQIVEDYEEACKIKVLSPKASATLARRCLQGMIRDFWSIRKSRLVDEINELNGKISPSEWDAIDAVRSVGNIGAHMEKDVNTIVDVEPEEAELLIKLLEDCFDTWYVARHDKEERQKALVALAESKQKAKKGKP